MTLNKDRQVGMRMYKNPNDHFRLASTSSSRHKTLNKCWFNVGPPSTSLEH